MRVRAVAGLLALAALASAQPVHFGVRAGIPLNGLMEAGSPVYRASTHRYTLGPALEVTLPRRFAARADLLYKRVEYNSTAGRGSAGRWELPVMAMYRPVPRLFAAAGVSLNRIGGLDGLRLAELRHRGTMGFCAAGGVEIGLGAFRLVPEIRITHWSDRNFGVRDAALRSRLTQTELLAGFVF